MIDETLEARGHHVAFHPDFFTKKELLEVATKFGIRIPAGATKKDISTALNAASAVRDDSEGPPPYPFTRHKDKVYIVGFAPSWDQTPWGDDEADLWGMNALYKVAPDKNWAAWFQLHDVRKHHPNDFDDHMKFLTDAKFPVFMWDKEIEKHPLSNAVAYPKEQIVERFGDYFTNTVSWMIAMAIIMGYKKIGIYGIDMAQEGEYKSQRPSCEYFIGVARGLGIEVFIPETSDLLKSAFLYGYDEGNNMMMIKLQGRLNELTERRNEMQRQRDESQAAYLQISGAMEDVQYWLRNWVHTEGVKT